jgi:hypothetical protein
MVSNGFAMSLRAGRAAVLVTGCLALFGCTGPAPHVMISTPTGPISLNSPAPAMPGGFVPPPPGMGVASPGPDQGPGRDGNYSGRATLLNSGGGQCGGMFTMTNFRVRGNSARFSGFRGTIDAQGGLQMAHGQDWIIGQFEGATFNGQINLSRRIGPGCSYMISLERVGP